MAKPKYKIVVEQRNEITRLRDHIKRWAVKLLNEGKINQSEFRAILQERFEDG